MDVRFRPYIWVGPQTPASKRRNAPFNSSWTTTLNKIEYELTKLRASEILIEAGFSDAQIRLDGWPKANQNPSHPGIKISFNQPGVGRVEYPCDSCRHWQDNVHSIALGLEALRAVERYGITARMQQYTGFRAIGSNGSTSEAQAEAFIRGVSELGAEANLREHLRAAMKRLHPDHGGRPELWDALTDAKRVLGL